MNLNNKLKNWTRAFLRSKNKSMSYYQKKDKANKAQKNNYKF